MRGYGVWYGEGEVLMSSDMRSVAALSYRLVWVYFLGVRSAIGVCSSSQLPAVFCVYQADLPTRCGQ